MSKISVIIPVYNAEKYLGQCLDSLIGQTFSDFEIICVNDGSNDSSLDILNSYADKCDKIKIINIENSTALPEIKGLILLPVIISLLLMRMIGLIKNFWKFYTAVQLKQMPI